MIYFMIVIGADTRYYVRQDAQSYSVNTNAPCYPWLVSISQYKRYVCADGKIAGSFIEVVVRDENNYLHQKIDAGIDLGNCTVVIKTDFCSFNGITVEAVPDGTMNIHFKVADKLTHAMTQNILPWITLGDAPFAATVPEENKGLSYIYPYGVMDSKSAGTTYKEPHGAYDCPCIDATNKDFLISCLQIEQVIRLWKQSGAGVWGNVAYVAAPGYAANFVVARIGGALATDKIRVDVKGINQNPTDTQIYGDPCLTNPADVRFHWLTKVMLNMLPFMDGYPSTHWGVSPSGTWLSAYTAANGKSIKIAGVINSFQNAGQWDSVIGISSGLDLYTDYRGKICIRMYSPVVYPTTPNCILNYERDCLVLNTMESERDIQNKIVAKYCNCGDGYYADLAPRKDTTSTGIYGIKLKEISLDFCWDKVSAEAIVDMILIRNAYERRKLTAMSRYLYLTNSVLPLDLNKYLRWDNIVQPQYEGYYDVEGLGIDIDSGAMEIDGFTMEY